MIPIKERGLPLSLPPLPVPLPLPPQPPHPHPHPPITIVIPIEDRRRRSPRPRHVTGFTDPTRSDPHPRHPTLPQPARKLAKRSKSSGRVGSGRDRWMALAHDRAQIQGLVLATSDGGRRSSTSSDNFCKLKSCIRPELVSRFVPHCASLFSAVPHMPHVPHVPQT